MLLFSFFGYLCVLSEKSANIMVHKTCWEVVQNMSGINIRFWGLVNCNGSKLSGWWFRTFFIFPSIGNNHPN